MSTQRLESRNGLYRLDPSNLTLTINPVEVDLESSEYRCDVIIQNPFGGGAFDVRGPPVTLRVYGKC